MTPAPRAMLIVDDETLFADAVKEDLGTDHLEVLTASTGAEALRICRERKMDVVMLDQRLPDVSGPEICPALLDTHEQMKIIFVTAYPNFENAMAAIKAGAFDYLSKPCELAEIHLSVQRCLRTLDLERVARVKDYHDRQEEGEAVLVGEDGGLAEAARVARLAALVDSPVLITGETGTGKTLFAKAIHFASRRRQQEFISVNCAAIPESLIESELFGFEKGTFTGAVASRAGLLEMAEGGTLFLDEIGEMPLLLQTRLLSVLEDHRVRRIGGRSFRTVDFRLIAATNADVETALKSRKLREDLYFRLNVIRVHLPPLRERAADIPLLVAHLLARIAGPEADLVMGNGEMARLADYAWPGNLRELRNVLERSVLLHRDGELKPSALLGPTARSTSFPSAEGSTSDEVIPLDELERRAVAQAISREGGNLTRAARALGISISTLRRKLPPAQTGSTRSALPRSI